MAEACPKGDTRARCPLSVQCFASFRRIDWTCRTAALSPKADLVAICSQRVDRRPFQVRYEAGSAVAATRWPSLAVMSGTSQARRDGTEEGVVAGWGAQGTHADLCWAMLQKGGGHWPYGHKDVAVGAAVIAVRVRSKYAR